MKLPNGYGSVSKLSGRRRKPYIVRKTSGWHTDSKGKKVQDFMIVGYAATKAEGLQILANYNNNPFDSKVSKMTFEDVYVEWSKQKFSTVSTSNIKCYTAAYKACGLLYGKYLRTLGLLIYRT